jgi:hypothetical protein
MRLIALSLAAAFIIAAAGTPALAAPKGKGMKAQMAEMKAKDPTSYAACEALARQRGHRIETENSALMNFIDGCMMGKQR